jgi:hypothetical protein
MTATEASEGYLITPTETDKKRYFLERLVNWRNERPWYSRFFQWNARRKIVNAIKRDMDNFASHKKLTKEQNLALVAKNISLLDRIKPGEIGSLFKLNKEDGERKYYVEINRLASGSYSTGEYSLDTKKPYSFASVNSEGQFSLTLDFSYLKGDQNPQIKNNTNMPIAAGAVFNLLINSIINQIPKA